MNSNEDKAWEARLDRALKDLPELTAPAGLLEKTMATLERRRIPAWHQRPWTTWPIWLRAASVVSMLAFVGAICAVKWEFAHTTLGARLSQRVTDHFSNWAAIFGAVDTLGRAAVTVARHLNGWVAAWCIVAATTAYLACIGLGTAAARLTLSRR